MVKAGVKDKIYLAIQSGKKAEIYKFDTKKDRNIAIKIVKKFLPDDAHWATNMEGTIWRGKS